jgi:hypothetical protein
MPTARTLEAECRQVLRGSGSTGGKEDELSTGRVWAAGFRHVTARPRLADVLKITDRLFNNNNNNIYLLQLGCHPVAVVI